MLRKLQSEPLRYRQKYSFRDQGPTIGHFILQLYPNDHGYIEGVEIKPKYRGMGYGKQMIAEAVERAYTLGAKTLGLHVDNNNIPAIKAYQAAGFFPQKYLRDCKRELAYHLDHNMTYYILSLED